MWQGLSLTLLAGFLGGSVLLPLKFMKAWPFQNSWTLYSLWAYLIMPWIVAFLTVPRLLSIYPEVSLPTILICAACGVGWGVAVVLFGISVNLVGLSLASAIIYGASVAVGSLSPLLISQRERLATKQGLMIVAANLIMIVGILACTAAGKKRDEVTRKTPPPESSFSDPHTFTRGVIASFIAAVLSSLFNIALAYGGEFNELAIERGANPINAANAQWAFTVTWGCLPNLVVSFIRLTRGGTWHFFGARNTFFLWLWPPLMGMMWFGGTALYGSGASLLGELGPVIGWPVYLSTMIIVGNLWGWVTGEWKNATPLALRLLLIGIIIQVVGFSVLSWSNR